MSLWRISCTCICQGDVRFCISLWCVYTVQCTHCSVYVCTKCSSTEDVVVQLRVCKMIKTNSKPRVDFSLYAFILVLIVHDIHIYVHCTLHSLVIPIPLSTLCFRPHKNYIQILMIINSYFKTTCYSLAQGYGLSTF